MATGTIVLRPSADISFHHGATDGYSYGYSMLSEVVADDDSTYIYMDINRTSGNSIESVFLLDGDLPQGKINVTDVRLYSRAKMSGNQENASYTCYFAVGTDQGGSSSDASTSSDELSEYYVTHTSTSNALVSQINSLLENGDFPQVSVKVGTYGSKSSALKSDGYARVTQIYMEIDYETIDVPVSHIYIKENGVWNDYSKVYKKIDGLWVEQADLSKVFDVGANYIRREV